MIRPQQEPPAWYSSVHLFRQFQGDVSALAPGKGAVLTDQADRFRAIVKAMLQQLGSQLGPAVPEHWRY
jgi:hypothetical protein